LAAEVLAGTARELFAVVEREAVVLPVVLREAAAALPPFAPAFAFCVAEPDLARPEVFEADDRPPVERLDEARDEEPPVRDFEADDDLEPPVDLDDVVDREVLVDFPAVLFDFEAAAARPPFAPAFAFCAVLPALAVFDEPPPLALDFAPVDFARDEDPEEVFALVEEADLPEVDLDVDDVDLDAVRDPLDLEPPDLAPVDFDLDDDDFDEEDRDPDDFEPEDREPDVFLVVGMVSTLRKSL
jgi:hypothetical protein